MCVPVNDPGWNTAEQIDDLPLQLRREIAHFFEVYKDLDPDRHSEVPRLGRTSTEAWERIRWAREQFTSGARRSS